MIIIDQLSFYNPYRSVKICHLASVEELQHLIRHPWFTCIIVNH